MIAKMTPEQVKEMLDQLIAQDPNFEIKLIVDVYIPAKGCVIYITPEQESILKLKRRDDET